MLGWSDVGELLRARLPAGLEASEGAPVATLALRGSVRVLACPEDGERDLALTLNGLPVLACQAPIPLPISAVIEPHLAPHLSGMPAACRANVGVLCDAVWALADWETLQHVRFTVGLRADGALLNLRAEGEFHVCDPGC